MKNASSDDVIDTTGVTLIRCTPAVRDGAFGSISSAAAGTNSTLLVGIMVGIIVLGSCRGIWIS